MRKPPADRWLQVGVAVLGAGSLIAVSWLIYVETASESFWAWPGVLGVVISALGLFFLIVGFLMRDEPPESTDRAGPAETQADIRGGIRRSKVAIGTRNRIR